MVVRKALRILIRDKKGFKTIFNLKCIKSLINICINLIKKINNLFQNRILKQFVKLEQIRYYRN